MKSALGTIGNLLLAVPALALATALLSLSAYAAEEGAAAGKGKVDEKMVEAWRTVRALDCARCHGADFTGQVGPSLISSVKERDADSFKRPVDTLAARPACGRRGQGALPANGRASGANVRVRAPYSRGKSRTQDAAIQVQRKRVKNIDAIHAYFKGVADGTVPKG